jgi:DNA-binding response OmpR family regulator
MRRLLLIDDDDRLRSVLAKSLAHAGYDVVQAADGLQGVELARVAPFDVVVTDIVMPVQEGVETIMQLRQEHPALPIIAISGGVNNSKVYLEIAAKIGANRILAKPFTPQELTGQIDAVMAEAKSAG